MGTNHRQKFLSVVCSRASFLSGVQIVDLLQIATSYMKSQILSYIISLKSSNSAGFEYVNRDLSCFTEVPMTFLDGDTCLCYKNTDAIGVLSMSLNNEMPSCQLTSIIC